MIAKLDIGLSAISVVAALVIGALTIHYLTTQTRAYLYQHDTTGSLGNFVSDRPNGNSIGYFAWAKGIWLAAAGITASTGLAIFGGTGLIIHKRRAMLVEDLEAGEAKRMVEVHGNQGL